MPAIERISFDQTGLLRFIAVGSVNDGKSTLMAVYCMTQGLFLKIS